MLSTIDEIRVGTSGWSYPQWKSEFYGNAPSAAWLSLYAGHCNAVEINSSFYRVPTEKAVAKWVSDTPPGFRFAVKAWRRITHELYLKNAQDELQFYLTRMAALKERLGAVLFQLPPNFACDVERLKSFLGLLPSSFRTAFEFRHPSWECTEVGSLLAERNIAWCASLGGKSLPDMPITADWSYLRFHGPLRYKGHYNDAYLQLCANWVVSNGGQGTYAFFNNTISGISALENARSFKAMLQDQATHNF